MFVVNGKIWFIRLVKANDYILRRSDGSLTVAVTDANENCVFVAENLHGKFLEKVLIHEMCHVFCFSYGIYMDVETEEIVADFLSTWGKQILFAVDEILPEIFRIAC